MPISKDRYKMKRKNERHLTVQKVSAIIILNESTTICTLKNHFPLFGKHGIITREIIPASNEMSMHHGAYHVGRVCYIDIMTAGN